MVKLLVTADWQIGMQAPHVADAAQSVRDARLDAARNVVRLANELEVDGLVLAGDTFEDNQVSPALAQKVLEILRASRSPVFVLPGNHDPWGPDAVLKKAWKNPPEHVRVLSSTEPQLLAAGTATLYPCPVTSKSSRHDPTESIPPRRPEDGIRIGVAHGSLRLPGLYEEDDFPIALDATLRRGLDLLVVGHWHSLFFYPAPPTPCMILYPGTHEQTKFGETNPGNACLVQIDRVAGPIQISSFPTGVLRWVSLPAAVYQEADVERLGRELRQISERGRTLVSLELSGAADMPAQEALRRLLEVELPALGFLHSRAHGAVLQEPSPEALEELARTPVLGQVVARLREEIQGGGPEAEVARQALLILWSIEGGN